jgi:3-hydroxyisobutyrate dehydrogenase
MEQKKIGWIGTGVMGNSMCSYLQKAGHEIFVYNRTKSKAYQLIQNGATWCDSPKEVAENSDIIFSIVGFPKDVKEVILEENGVLAGSKPNTIIIDMTTSSPELAKEISKECEKQNITAFDCPVTGGDLGAKNGTLTIFAGGDENKFQIIKPLLELMGKNIGLMGNSGSGQHAKLANQISIAGSIIGTCETLVYAKHAGLDLEEIIKLVGSGSAGSWQLNNMGPRIIQGDFNPGFFIKHFIKDLGLALEECEKMKIDLPGLKLAFKLYNKARYMGYEDLGTQGLYKLFE